MPKKPISIASRKAKARVAQNWVAQKIADLTGYTCGKDELICGRPMGQSGVDVQLIGEAREDAPWSIEVKNVEKVNLYDAIKQAKDNQMNGTDWLVILKKNKEDYIAVLDAEVFFDLLRLIPGRKKGR